MVNLEVNYGHMVRDIFRARIERIMLQNLLCLLVQLHKVHTTNTQYLIYWLFKFYWKLQLVNLFRYFGLVVQLRQIIEFKDHCLSIKF